MIKNLKIKTLSQNGMTLVELMIAMLLGLILTASLVQVFLANKQTFMMADFLGRAEENGRYAMNILTDDIRMAGYSSGDPVIDLMPNAILGENRDLIADTVSASSDCNVTEGWCTRNGDESVNPMTDATDAARTQLIAGSDRIALQFDPVDDRDCTGVATPSASSVIANVYWVAKDSANDDMPTLYCRGYDPDTKTWMVNSTAQPLVAGIDTLQVLYGEISGTGIDGDPNRFLFRYISADRVTDWRKIKRVRIAVLARANGEGSGNRSQKSYAVLDAGLFTFTDTRTRVLYETTVSMNNVNAVSAIVNENI
ncbi:PilW family protein [Litoribacillus peritrichatus]|uniref:Prepilin-type N-terminal cleavage/methylation domain-containing protein n=1 Tax=Litoribacillus peritrichatus TaxID=718191 RepID=A0ABP7MTY5_9GAMM